MQTVGFDASFMFKYSERPGTYASKHLPDNIAEEIKIKRLEQMIDLQNKLSAESNKRDIGQNFRSFGRRIFQTFERRLVRTHRTK